MARLDKALLLQQLRERVEEDMARMQESHRLTHEGATHEESKPENDKDTRGLESSYLARGQAQRVVELTEAAAALAALQLREFGDGDPILLSALVAVELSGADDDVEEVLYFLSPAGGGLRLEQAGKSVLVITTQSPIGRALVGQRVDADVEFRTPQGLREGVIVSVD